jgi:arylsulfatase
MRTGFTAGSRKFKVHLDGFDFLPFFRGKERTGPRDAIYYFDQSGNLNAIRIKDWKISFAINSPGNIATATRETPSWASITNLRMDPYERGMSEGGESLKFFGQQMWLLVPVQAKIKEFFADFEDFPYQSGSSLNAANIGYGLLRQHEALKRLKDVESFAVAGGAGR